MTCIAFFPRETCTLHVKYFAPLFHEVETDHNLLISKENWPILKEKFATLFCSKLRLSLLYSAGYVQLTLLFSMIAFEN